MSRYLAPLGFAAIIGCVALVAYRVAQPSRMVIEADNRDVLETIAAGVSAQTDALTPTKTPYLTSTPTATPYPPTETPLPTWDAQASPGVYIVANWTETPVVASTTEPRALPPCATVTPMPYADVVCGVS